MARGKNRPKRKPMFALPSPNDAVERIRSKTVVSETGCWNWRGHTRRYPQISYGNQYYTATRLMMLAISGPFDPMLEVCHRCNNDKCVNPEHLFLGTRSDNVRDSVQKRRHGLSKKDFCKRGHSLSGDNLWVRNY